MVKGLRAAGVEKFRLEVDPGGKTRIIVGEVEGLEDINPCDRLLTR